MPRLKATANNEDTMYSFQISDLYGRCQSIAVFISPQNYRAVLALDEEEFSGYISDTEITEEALKNVE